MAQSSSSISLPALMSLSLSPSMSLSVTVLDSDRKDRKLHVLRPVGRLSPEQLPDDSRSPRFAMSGGVRICPNLCLYVCLSSWLFSETETFKYLLTIYWLCDLREMTECLYASIN